MVKKKVTLAEIIMVVFCAIGLTLFVLSRFIDTDLDLGTIGLAFNGVGIFALVYVMTKRNKPAD